MYIFEMHAYCVGSPPPLPHTHSVTHPKTSISILQYVLDYGRFLPSLWRVCNKAPDMKKLCGETSFKLVLVLLICHIGYGKMCIDVSPCNVYDSLIL